MIEINDIRAWHTAIMLLVFVGIVIWAYSRRKRKDFNEAANLPFADQDMHEQSIKQLKEKRP